MPEQVNNYYKDTNQNSRLNGLRNNSSKVSSLRRSLNSANNSAVNQLSLSFVGCGFLSFYYLGVTACLKQFKQIDEKTIFCGASSGTVAGLALSLDLPLDESTAQLLELAIKVRAKPLGLIQPSCDMHKMINDILVAILPDDCHKRLSGRFYISVTRVRDGKNVLISQYDSKEDLIRAIQCSSYMPFLSGMFPPKYKGIAYIDGALSNNAPKISENTITVSPWSGEFDICPMNDTSIPLQVMFYNKLISLSPLNLYRMTQIAFPPPWHLKTTLCQQGFNDTLRFLLRNNMISCQRCLSTPSPFSSLESINEDSEEEEDNQGSDDSGYDRICPQNQRQTYYSLYNCTHCQTGVEFDVNDSINETVIQAIEEAENKINQKIINSLSSHRSIKLVLMLCIPILLYFEFMIAIIFGIFTNNWSSEVFRDIFNILKIMVTNGLTGRDHRSIMHRLTTFTNPSI